MEKDQTFIKESKPGRETDVEGKPLLANGRCACCRFQIVAEEGEAAIIKAAVIKADLVKKITNAKCPRCKSWLIVPLQYVVQ
jgi:hypothetical protein